MSESPNNLTDTAGIAGRALVLRYGRHQPVVINGQTIEVPAGKITALIGPNGSGKSTLLKALARQLTPESGMVLLDGCDVSAMPRPKFARRVGMLFQENTAPAGLTVEDLVFHGRYGHRRLLDALTPADCEAVERALQLAGIVALRARRVGRLSAGQKQLAWIAMALAQETDYLFLDEPTTFLDPAHQFEVMDLVRRLNHELGKTIVLVVHDLNLAAHYADCIFALREGRIAAAGTPDEVLDARTLRRVFEIEATILRDGQGRVRHCLPTGRVFHAQPEKP